MYSKKCLHCKKEFQVRWKYLLDIRTYCSHRCSFLYNETYKISSKNRIARKPLFQVKKNCSLCGEEYSVHRSQKGSKYCSRKCQCLGHIEKLNSRRSETAKNSIPGFFSKKHSEESKMKISLNRKGKMVGENHPNYIKDRSLLKGRHARRTFHDYDYKKWRIEVYTRDNFKCKIDDDKCSGRLEAHHILPWRDYPELRYKINNGITLCHFHHPRKVEEEKRLVPTFQELVLMSVSE